jgi:sRNA-binding protein
MLQYRKALPREHLEALIDHLAATYPKAFFKDKFLKRPLKKNILIDLERDRCLNDEQREAAVSYYTRDWNYEYALLAGAKRIDLSGEEVGTVTALEANEARERVRVQKEERRRTLASRHAPADVARSLHAAGKIPTDSLSKINVVPLKASAQPQPSPEPNPITPADPQPTSPQPLSTPTAQPLLNGVDLGRLRTLWESVDSICTNTPDEALRHALAAAALRVLVAEAQNTITELEKQESM